MHLCDATCMNYYTNDSPLPQPLTDFCSIRIAEIQNSENEEIWHHITI